MRSVPQVPSRELGRLLEKENVLVVDVREPDEHAQGVIAGATLMPLGQVGRRFSELPKDRPVALICRTGNRSQAAAEFLMTKGYDVMNVEGGMVDWPGPTERP